MLSICRYSSANLQTLLVICTVCFQLPEVLGQSSTCSKATCQSRSYRHHTICRVKHAVEIFNATVVRRVSYSSCNYYNGLPGQYKGYSGVFGYYSNILWTKNRCKANFKVCYSVPSLPSTTISTTHLSSSSTTVTESSSQTSVTTHGQDSSSITSDVHSNKSDCLERPTDSTNSNTLLTTVPPILLIVFGLIVIGTVLVMKWQKKKHAPDEQKADGSDAIKEGKANTGLEVKRTNDVVEHAYKDELSNDNTYCVLDPQGQYSTHTFDVKQNDEAKATNESAYTSARMTSTCDSHKYFILDPQIHSLSDKTETREDSVSQQLKSNATSEHNFSGPVIDSHDLYSSCDQETVDIQMLPNHEYNVINMKRNVTGNESNYDVLSSSQFTPDVTGDDEYSHIGNTRVVVRDDTYSHITLNQESEGQ